MVARLPSLEQNRPTLQLRHQAFGPSEKMSSRQSRSIKIKLISTTSSDPYRLHHSSHSFHPETKSYASKQHTTFRTWKTGLQQRTTFTLMTNFDCWISSWHERLCGGTVSLRRGERRWRGRLLWRRRRAGGRNKLAQGQKKLADGQHKPEVEWRWRKRLRMLRR
jgi:hypothetical protein